MTDKPTDEKEALERAEELVVSQARLSFDPSRVAIRRDDLRVLVRLANAMHQASDAGDDDAELIELLELAGDYGCDVFNSFPDKTSPCALRVEADVNRFNAARDRLQAKAHD
jgi:hypothetical protein